MSKAKEEEGNPIIGIIVLGSHSAIPHNTANNNSTANGDDGTADNGNNAAKSDNGTMASSARTPTPMVRRRRREGGSEEEEEDSGGLRIPWEGEEDAEEDAPTSRPPTNIEFRIPLEDERRYKFIASFNCGRKLNGENRKRTKSTFQGISGVLFSYESIGKRQFIHSVP